MSHPQSSTHNDTATAVGYAEQAQNFLDRAHEQDCLAARLDMLSHAHWSMLQSATEYDLIIHRIEAFEYHPDPDRITSLRAQAKAARTQADNIHQQIINS